MARLAVDIDGTIDTSSHIWELIKDHEVYFLTTKRLSKEERVKQLQDLGITHYRDIVIVEGSSKAWIGMNKGIWCKENKIDIMVENDPDVLYWIKEASKTIECLLFC